MQKYCISTKENMCIYWQYSVYEVALEYNGASVLLHSLQFLSPCSEIQPHPVPSLRTAKTTILLSFILDYSGELVPEDTFTHIIITKHPLSTSSTYCDPWLPPCSICVYDSVLAQLLSKSSLVDLCAWNPPLHTPYISSPTHYFLFATHGHTITTVLVQYRDYILYSCLSLSLSFLRLLSFILTSHIHPTILSLVP